MSTGFDKMDAEIRARAERCFKERFKDGFGQGFKEGFVQGFKEGFEQGFKEGKEQILRKFIKMSRASCVPEDEIFVKVKQLSEFSDSDVRRLLSE